MLLGCITALTRCVLLLQMGVVWSGSLSVCHDREPCKNGGTDSFRMLTCVGLGNHALDGGPDLPMSRAILTGEGVAHC